MNTKRLWLIVGILAALALAAYGFFLIFKKEPSPLPEPAANNLPPVTAATSTIPAPPGDTVTIGTPEGVVAVRNFYMNPVETDSEWYVVIKVTDQYRITYLRKTSAFLITITQQPFVASRELAEAEFLENLQISKADACKLSVSLGIPYSIDPARAGHNYGLSFCIGTVQ